VAKPAPLAPAARAQDPAAQYGEVTIPAGQSLLVRMIDGVDSSKNQVGDVFHASLETDLYINNNLVARKGTDLYGRLAEAKEAGHFSGSAELQLELIRIVIDGHDYPLVSSDYTLKGQGRGSDTAKKVSGGAVFGAIIGAIAGGGKGAAIGAGAGSAAGAGVQRQAGEGAERDFAGFPAGAAGHGVGDAEVEARGTRGIESSTGETQGLPHWNHALRIRSCSSYC
jgi:hypothetical protein